jgi:outer membrane protein OmpA-like peptidoglycan-associated protein
VGEYLLSLGAKKATQMVYKGMGSREPIADNATEAGKSRNRRVEITILEN